MKIHLSLGSNLPSRREHLRDALRLLEQKGLQILRVSPVVESPALLPKSVPSDWNLPFLNLAAICETRSTPQQMRKWAIEIESELGRERDRGDKWSPRPIDIDILLWGDEIISTSDLTIPHRDLHKRGFVLTPLVALEPLMTIPGRGPKTLLEWSAELRHHIPLWMGIVNVTPDSFSDGGLYMDWARVEPHVEKMVAAGVHMIDIGAQSTAPGAQSLGPDEEWSRLAPVLEPLAAKYGSSTSAPLDPLAPQAHVAHLAPLAPLLSVDTFHPQVAEKALNLGVAIINDVSGLTSPEMIEIAKASDADWIAMHQLTLPVDPDVTLAQDRDPVEELEGWLRERIQSWESAGLDLNRIIFDPGIGFGKTALQSLELLRQAGRFRGHGLRTMVGHSRKSFMKSFSSNTNESKDLTTIGASLELCGQGVDILRVHNVPDHIAAYRGWSHLVG